MDQYDAFRTNPFISGIAAKERWTVSTADKVPIDMYALEYKGIVAGAKFNNELSLATLDKVHGLIPAAANYAFYMDALKDGFVLLDIEPKCPDEVKAKLLAMPCRYIETSMSGKGVHMVFDLPADLLDKYPDARQKVVMKEKHGWYEILLLHYVTFTGRALPQAMREGCPAYGFRDLFEELARKQTVAVRSDVEVEAIDGVDYPSTPVVLDRLRNRQEYRKTLDDFDGDKSKFEFGFICHKYFWLKRLLLVPAIMADHRYTDAEAAWLLYTVASEQLPKRPKHEELRNGMPWLMYLAYEVIAQNKNDPSK